MDVTYIDHMGSDLSVVNAARVSFDKESELVFIKEDEDFSYVYGNFGLSERDRKLIAYLARHNHWSPFAHTAISLRVKAPIFVARQLVKHQVGLAWNEVSRRYVDSEPEFYTPYHWRKRARNVKQGSSPEAAPFNYTVYDTALEMAYSCYANMLAAGVCPEQARMVLPQSTYTEWVWTGSVMAFARVCNQRLDPHTQKETQEIAWQISAIIRPLFPVSWKELVE